MQACVHAAATGTEFPPISRCRSRPKPAAFASFAGIGGSRCEAPIVAYRSFVGRIVVHSTTAKQYCPKFVDRGAPANSAGSRQPTNAIAVVDGRTRSTSLEKQDPTALWTRR